VITTGLRIFSEPKIVDVISSTQEGVKNERFPHFTPLVAKSQTKGRGRKGKWYSPPEGGLYFSVKIPKDFFPQTELSPVALVCGFAVSETVDSYVFSKIKWPNDVYVRGKKVAGILVEASKENLVIGIGVNLNIKNFPNNLHTPASSIYLETQQEVDMLEFLNLLLDNLSVELLKFRSEGFKPFVEPINRKLLWRGQRVVVDNIEYGKLLGITERGTALIKTCFGKVKEFPYGDISLRKATIK
jgi:BirA family biotin operon repressor/biotin-[acetyl-CoA-carboxylase] ligase